MNDMKAVKARIGVRIAPVARRNISAFAENSGDTYTHRPAIAFLS